MRTNGEILQAFDFGYPKFSWFIIEYFGDLVDRYVVHLRKTEDVQELVSVLNTIWFRLPDSQFNILENPEGWSEFLNVIEE